MNIKLAYEDEHILVCVKPPGIATQTAKTTVQDMVSLIKNYLVQKGASRNPYLGVVHRLDQPVSGLLVFAKTQKAAAALSKQLQGEAANKEYLALCLGHLPSPEGKLIHYLKKDRISNQAVVTGAQDKEGKYAELSYRAEEYGNNSSLLSVRLKTGRFHQIRAQFLAAGNPLLGDRKYKTEESEKESLRQQIGSVALCANGLSLIHPITGKQMNFTLDREDLLLWYKRGREM